MRLWGLRLHGRGDNRLYTVARWFAVPLFCGVYGMRLRGGHHLPRYGPAIVIMNHKANIDPVVAGAICDRPLRFMAKKELFANKYLRRLITHLGAFPIDRGSGDREALRTSMEILSAGQLLLMFPEGHRQRDLAVHEFMPGVALIALRSGAPVIPLAVDGTQRMVRDGKLRHAQWAAAMGPAVDFSDLSGRNSKTYAVAAERMHAAVAELYATLL
jgi:1-acyl-sn-glycerol-3-phosphate acyltransferase